MADEADRALGVVAVSAAGDALGAGYEFGPALDDHVPVVMAGGGPFGWAPGEWTDDTQTALAVLHAITDPGGGTVVDRVERRLRRWFASGPVDIGNQTRAVLGRPGPLVAIAADHAAAHPHHSAGNGSLMRTGPVALARIGDPAGIAALAADVSRLTHADPDCVDASVLWSVAIGAALVHDPDVDESWSWVDELAGALDQLPAERRPAWRQRIDEAAAAVPRQFPRNGWVVHAFQAALAAICSTEATASGPDAHVVAALEACVRAGGDTDTVAAIAGAFLGARHGASVLPDEWTERLHGRCAYDEPVLDVHDLADLVRWVLDADGDHEPGPCPTCGVPLVPIAYGLPGPAMVADAEAGRVVLGGCIIDADAPRWTCPACDPRGR